MYWKILSYRLEWLAIFLWRPFGKISVSIHHRNLRVLAIEMYKIKDGLSLEIMKKVFPSNRSLQQISHLIIFSKSLNYQSDLLIVFTVKPSPYSFCDRQCWVFFLLNYRTWSLCLNLSLIPDCYHCWICHWNLIVVIIYIQYNLFNHLFIFLFFYTITYFFFLFIYLNFT